MTIKHKDPGPELTYAEYISDDAHEGGNKIEDAAKTTSWDTEPSPGAGEVVGQVKSVECYRAHDTGITDFPKQSSARAYLTTSPQSISTITWTRVALNAESWDIQGEFDSTTNSRFTATETGRYSVKGSVWWNAPLVDQKSYYSSIYKNGSGVIFAQINNSGTAQLIMPIADDISLISGDYLELWVYHNTGSTVTLNNSSSGTSMAIHKLS